MTRSREVLFALGTIAALLIAHQRTCAQQSGLPMLADAMAEDAELADVFFLDDRRGWAVGDRGVIWHTADGGRQWQRQASGTTAPLSSISFVSPTHGWAVGGATTAYTHATEAVVLQTTDGGQTWSTVPTPMLPALTKVKFFSTRHGIAAGAGTAFYPAGAFSTGDGGKSWQSLSAETSGTWLAADFLDPEQGALAGVGGKFATISKRDIRTSPIATPDRRAFHALQLTPPTGGWLVGDGGFVRATRDLGHSWQPPPTELPEVARAFDWQTVATVGSHVWIAGSPGTIVLHSPDNGTSWELQSTGHSPPLRGLAFADSQRGWAVGALGTILATQDGGRTWQLQRAGGRRAALWAAFTRPERTPLELIAKHAAAEGYITAATYLFAAREDSGDLSALETSRTHEAVVGSGGSAAEIAWQLPLPHDAAALSTEALLAELNRQTDSQAMEQLEARLVRDLRMWRPEVVLIELPEAMGGDPAAALLQSAIESALVAAADATRYPELAAAGLKPWQPKRLCGLEPQGRPGALRISTGEFSSTLGSSLAQFAAANAGLLTRDYAPPQANYDLSVLHTTAPGTSLQRDLFDGLVVNRDSDARRPQTAPAVGELDMLRRLAQQRRHMQELLKRSAGNEAWAGQVVNLTGGLDANSGGELLFQLAEGYREAGQLDMSADTYYLLARRYADHPLVPRALTWLVQYYASGELAHRGAAHAAEQIRNQANFANVPPVGRDEERSANAQSTPQLETTSTGENLSPDARWKRASILAQYLEGARPAMYAEPSLRFPLAAAHRNLGFTKQADQYYVIVGKQATSAEWRDCADAERWLREPERLPPTKPIANCKTTADRPHLNGIFDEPLWQRAEIIRVGGLGRLGATGSASASADSIETAGEASGTRAKPAAEVTTDQTPTLTLPLRGRGPEFRQRDSDFPPPVGEGLDDNLSDPPPSGGEGLGEGGITTTTLRLLRDNEFLYLAIACAKQPNIDYSPNATPRPRDADLSMRDRVTLRIDIDRDYTTAYELTVDHRGWTHDRCWGDVHWNPSWFVAAAETETEWTIEAAIPLGELDALPFPPRAVWAIGIDRTIPGQGSQSWTGQSAPPTSPDRFGLLLFE